MDTVATNIDETSRARSKGRIASFVELTKPRIAILLVLTSAAGLYLGSLGQFDWLLFAHSVIAITLLAFGVATLNQYWERDIDKLMKRTAYRPLPTSTVSPTEALIFGLAQCIIAELYLLFAVN